MQHFSSFLKTAKVFFTSLEKSQKISWLFTKSKILHFCDLRKFLGKHPQKIEFSGKSKIFVIFLTSLKNNFEKHRENPDFWGKSKKPRIFTLLKTFWEKSRKQIFGENTKTLKLSQFLDFFWKSPQNP